MGRFRFQDVFRCLLGQPILERGRFRRRASYGSSFGSRAQNDTEQQAPATTRRRPNIVGMLLRPTGPTGNRMRTTLAVLIAGLSLPTAASELAPRTALDDYIDKVDDSHAWAVRRDGRGRRHPHRRRGHGFPALAHRCRGRPAGMAALASPVHSGHGLQRHRLFSTSKVAATTATFPKMRNPGMVGIANATGSVVAELFMVPKPTPCLRR